MTNSAQWARTAVWGMIRMAPSNYEDGARTELTQAVQLASSARRIRLTITFLETAGGFTEAGLLHNAVGWRS